MISPFASGHRFSRSVQVDHRHCRPAANETMLGLRRAVGTEVVHWLGANKPAYKLDPGFLEHPRLSPRAVIGPGARFLDFLFTGAPRRRRSPGGGDWPTLATPLRSSHSRPRHKHVEPRSRYRREFAAWPEQVSFFLAWLSFAPPTCQMPLGQSQCIPQAYPGGRVSPRF